MHLVGVIEEMSTKEVFRIGGTCNCIIVYLWKFYRVIPKDPIMNIYEKGYIRKCGKSRSNYK